LPGVKTMAEIGFTESAKGVVPPRNNAPEDATLDSGSQWGAVAQVLYF